MGRFDEDLIDDDEEDVEETKARRQRRFNNKKTHSNRKPIIPPKYRMEKVKRKAYRPKISWDDYENEDDYNY